MTGCRKLFSSDVSILKPAVQSMKDEFFPEKLDERYMCLWIFLTGEQPNFVSEAEESVL